MIEELIIRVFSTRNAAHLAHWKTKSYSEHVALGDFYDSTVDILDGLVEAYQGCFGLVSVDEKAKASEKTDIVARIQDDAEFMNENRSEICRDVPALENILDTLVDKHLTTVYKLKNLK